MPTPENPATAEPTFEQSLAELQQIVADLESAGLGLEDSLSRFEQGVTLLHRCHQTLEQAEKRIELLTGFDAAGNPSFTAFDATATAEQQGQSAGRRTRRKAATPKANPATSEKTSPDSPPSAEPPAVESSEPVAPAAADPDEGDNLPRLF